MKKSAIPLALVLLLANAGALAIQVPGQSPQSTPSAPPPARAMPVPQSDVARIHGVIDSVDPGAGTVRLKNGALFTLGKDAKIFSGSGQTTRYELRPGVTVTANVNLKTQEASHVWIAR